MPTKLFYYRSAPPTSLAYPLSLPHFNAPFSPILIHIVSIRCFISAEPPPLPTMTAMPESLMRGCIKVANEAPADLQSNLARSWASFSQDRIDACASPVEFKA